MRSYTRALTAVAIAAPLALAFPVAASAAPLQDECLSQNAHDTWANKVGWYTSGKAQHEANLTKAQGVVTERTAALSEAQAAAESLAAQVRKASADKNAALQDIEYRKGLISAMQAKLPTYVAKVEAAKDEIEKQQKAYRKAKDAGDTAAMDAAHAAADAAREARDAAQAQVEHYTQGQVFAQQHIDKSQAIVDAATALGKALYPKYQAAQQAVKTAQAAVETAKAPLAGLEGKVADITKYLATAQTNAALPVCEEETTPPATGGDDTGGSDQGGEPGTDGEQPGQPVEQPAAPATSVVTVPQSVATQPAAAQPAAVTTAAAPAGNGSSTPLAYTGAGDIAIPIATGMVAMVAGAAVATWASRQPQ